jgi:YidC/Oxa1 family membrane protein insertase
MEQNDQRNLLLAMVLMFLVMIGYQAFILGPQDQARKEARARAAAESAQQQTSQPASIPGAVAAPGSLGGPGAISGEARSRDAIVEEETAAGQRVLLDAPSVDGSISLVGSRIDDVALKTYYETLADKQAERKDREIELLAPANAVNAFYAVVNWIAPAGQSAAALPAENSVWTREGSGPLTATSPLQLVWTGDGLRIDRTIAIDDHYMFTVTDRLTNTGAASLTLSQAVVLRQRQLADLLKPVPQSHTGVTGAFDDKKNQNTKYRDLAKGDPKFFVETPVAQGWIALTSKYWMAAAIPDHTSGGATMRANIDRPGGVPFFQAGYTRPEITIAPGQTVTESARIFAGAKRVDVLEDYQKSAGIPAFTDAVDWTWLGFITKPFFWLLKTFQEWTGNFGLAILMLTVAVKTVFFPVQWKMYESMSKMRKVAPEMQELQKRYKEDRPRLQKEMMSLYQREKVNPLAGCLPMIPQMFVFYALYHVLVVAIEMRHAPFFGWVQDMSAPDPTTIFNLFGLIPWSPTSIPLIGSFFEPGSPLHIGVWPLLYGGTMFALQGMSPPPTDPTQRMIMRWLPLIFLVLFAGFAAGLVIYWVWSNLITMGQQYFIMRRQGVETEFDKFLKKYVLKPKPEAS